MGALVSNAHPQLCMLGENYTRHHFAWHNVKNMILQIMINTMVVSLKAGTDDLSATDFSSMCESEDIRDRYVRD